MTDFSHSSCCLPYVRCGEIFNDSFISNFLLSVTVNEFLKIGQYLAKLWRKVYCLVFYARCRYVDHKTI